MALPRQPRAVITGAASGLGRAFACVLARRGAHLLLTDIDLERAAETAGQARALGAATAVVASCDVRDSGQVDALLEQGRQEGVDLLINNAGVAVGGNVGEVSLEDWRWAVDVNLWGVVHGCHTFAPYFRERGRGHIINVASAAGLLAPPGFAPYTATKAAVIALSESLAGEVGAHGVVVTVLCPTFFRTNIMTTSRGAPEDQVQLAEALMDRSGLDAEDVAAAALVAAEAGRLYAVPMRDGRLLWRLKRALPGGYARLSGRTRHARILERLLGIGREPSPDAD